MTVTVMGWVILGVCLAVVALAAIGYFAFGVFRAVKALMKDVADASRRFADASAPRQAGSAPADR